MLHDNGASIATSSLTPYHSYGFDYSRGKRSIVFQSKVGAKVANSLYKDSLTADRRVSKYSRKHFCKKGAVSWRWRDSSPMREKCAGSTNTASSDVSSSNTSLRWSMGRVLAKQAFQQGRRYCAQ